MGDEVRSWSTPEPERDAQASPGLLMTRMPSMDVHGQTSMGCARTRNDDQFLIADLDRWALIRHRVSADSSRWSSGDQGKLLAVASGITGAECARATSMATIDSVARYVTSTMSWVMSSQPTGSDPRLVRERVVDELEYVLPRCQLHLRRIAEEKGRAAPLDGTITLVYVLWPDMFVIHAGSSRCYLFRTGGLRRLTREGAGDPAPHGSLDQPRIPVIARTVGRGDHARADVHHVSLQTGDRILLCTGGLTNHLDDERIASHLRAELRASRACQRLSRAARLAGSTDNLTVLLARFW